MKRLLILIVLCCLPALAQDRKAELVQVLGQKKPVHAQVIDKLVTLNLSPAAWDYLITDTRDGQPMALGFANTLIGIALTMGWGDVDTVDRNAGYDGKSPLVAEMIDSWKGKMALAVAIPQTDPEDVKKAVYQLSGVPAPFQQDFIFKPRGGKAFLTWTCDSKAKELGVRISKDGNTYTVICPVNASMSQSALETALKEGR